MSVLLPTGLPAGFAVEPATSAHVAEVHELFEAEQSAAFGFCTDTVEDVRALLDPPAGAASHQHLVRDTDGRVVQHWLGLRDPGDPITHAIVVTHPELPDTVSDALAGAGFAVLLGWVRAHPPAGVEGDLTVHSGCPAGSAANPRHLAEAGFTRKRTFWEMVGPVTDAHRTPPDVPGLAVVATHDTATLHAVLNEAFVGHYGFTPTTFEDWLAVEEKMPGYDPDLLYLATVDGEPAAAMTLLRRAETEGEMYVGELATLDRFRRRGIASALLARAFEVAARQGLPRLSLHVDSENTHAAPSVYRRAGLEVRTAWWAYARTLPR